MQFFSVKARGRYNYPCDSNGIRQPSLPFLICGLVKDEMRVLLYTDGMLNVGPAHLCMPSRASETEG
jgi:hypothetical protein